MCEITSLHSGMNLRDNPSVFEEGEIGESLGCDFGIPGQVTPMKEGLVTWEMPSDIVDAKIVYINQTRYLFTTHADGLHVTYGVYPPYTLCYTTLLDADFTGSFRVIPINDEYVVMTNGTINRKWKPGWASAYQWGLNTPPVPQIAAGAMEYLFEDFEDNSDWTFTGGGAAGNVEDDATVYYEGAGSMKVSLTALTTIVATKLVSLDLSGYTDASFNLPYLQEYTDRITNFVVKFSCQEDGGFTTDYYHKTVTPTLTMGVYGTQKPGYDSSAFYVDYAGRNMESEGIAVANTIRNITKGVNAVITNIQDQDATKDRIDGTLAGSEDWDVGDWMGVYLGVAGTWVTDNDILASAFTRVGTDADCDWSTITAIRIEVTAAGSDTYINFDKWIIDRGTSTATYQVAVAYQNELGNYGPYSDYCDAVEITGYGIEITGLTPDTDPQTVARRIVVLGGTLTDPWVFTVDDNTSTTASYAEDVTELEDVEEYFNNNPPPAGLDILEFGGRIFIVGDSDYPGRVRYSEAMFYEAFPAVNHRTIVEGDSMIQLSILDQYLAIRGKGREYFMLTGSDSPSTWPIIRGAKEGCASNNLLLDYGNTHVFASVKGFIASGQSERGDYLPKVHNVVADYSEVVGAMAGKHAYIAFTDTDGVSRVLRIDNTLGKPVAHYVENIAPVAIFADEIVDKVYYALGDSIYEFNAGESCLAAKLVIPQYCGSKQVKDWSGLYYELSGDSLELTLKADRDDVTGSITLAERLKADYPQSFPQGIEARLLEMTLQSEAGADFIMYLPWKIIEVGYAD